LANPTKTKVQY